MGSLTGDSTIVKHWRENPPSSYSLKINKLSQLTLNKYESRLFLSGGYNWRLVIYPKGNQSDNGSGFISMYVEFDKTCLSSTLLEVFAYLTFFVYNKKENRYFSIQDVEVKRFNALRTVWGLSEVVSVKTFSDPKNGYIFEGEQCEFGVDVVIASPPFTKWEVVSFDEKLLFPKFIWSVKKFSGHLQLYPKGDDRGNNGGKWLSIFLNLDGTEIVKADEKIYVRALVKVIDPRGSNHVTQTINNWYTESSIGWGAVKFLTLAKLQEAYLDVEDTLNVEVEFKVLSVTKHSD